MKVENYGNVPENGRKFSEISRAHNTSVQLIIWLPAKTDLFYTVFILFVNCSTVASKLQSARFAGRRRRREPSRPTEMRQLIDLQMKQLQLERKRLRVESEKLECLRGIQSSLSIMCTALMPCLGVELVVGEE